MNITQFIIDIAARGDGQAISKIRSVQNGLDMANRHAEKLKNGLRQAFSSLPGAEFFMNPIVALTTGVGVVAKVGMEAEKTATAFNVLVGNEEKAAKALGELNSYADNTLWDRTTTQEAAKTMLGFGISTENVVGDLKMLGDVAMGDKNKLRQLALVFGQISAAGKLQGQDLMQLINAGYNPLMDISEMTGKSVAKLKDEMSKGLITFDMVRGAFEKATGPGGKFANMTERMAKTAGGAFEQLKGKLLATLLELYKVIEPFIIPVFTAMGKVLEVIGKMATWAAEKMKKFAPVIKVVAVAIGAYVVATNLATVATAALSTVVKVLFTILTLNPFGLIVAGVAALTAAVIVCWNKFAGFRAAILTVWDTVKGFGEILKQYVLDRIQGLITGIGTLGLAFSKLFKGDFAGAWDTAKTGALQVSGITAKATAGGAAKELAGSFRDRYAVRLDDERKKQEAKDTIQDPKAAAGTSGASLLGGGLFSNGGGEGTSDSSTANAITTGGTRNTSIVLNIGKFFEDVVINNTSNKDYKEIRDAVLESVNRSLEIAISAAR